MKKQQRLRFVILIVLSLTAAVGLALTALRDNVSFFHPPHEIHALQAQHSPRVAVGKVFRLGGMVKDGSVQRDKQEPVTRFIVTDYEDDILVVYRGILPDLFREGQGVVARGSLDAEGRFIASELLAKHDEKYMPPEVAKAMKGKKAP